MGNMQYSKVVIYRRVSQRLPALGRRERLRAREGGKENGSCGVECYPIVKRRERERESLPVMWP